MQVQVRVSIMKKRIKIRMPTDRNGLVGRECPACKRYFKLRFGTGLPTSVCHCPYCEHEGEVASFMTADQEKYVRSMALREVQKQVVEPAMRDFQRSIQGLGHSSAKGVLQIKISSHYRPTHIPVRYYREKRLETDVTCDHCGLQFAIYGVFGNCPDCCKLNASVVLDKSVEVAHKLTALAAADGDAQIREAMLKQALSDGVSAFDAVGKALRARYPERLPRQPKNLFQNLDALSNALASITGVSLPDLIPDDYPTLYRLFQIRHIYQHNMGVVDEDCVRRLPDLAGMKDRKYPLHSSEIHTFLDSLQRAGNRIVDEIVAGVAGEPARLD